MLKYTVKRLAQSLLTVMIVATIVFLLMRMLPTDYYFTEEQLTKLSEEQKEEQLRIAGLMDPIPEQLMRFYKNTIRFDFGESRRIQSGVAVEKLIGTKFAVSMKNGLIAMTVALVIGIPMGILQAMNKGKLFDQIGTAYTIFVNAVPALVSYSLILVFGAKVLGLPSMYSTRNVAKSSILPIICLSIGSIAHYALWMRRYMIDEVNKDYIKLARVKGLSTSQIMYRHVLRNAFVPLVQYIPASMLLTISGSLLVERFFSVPGMGPLLTDAINLYDINVVQTLVILYTSLSVLGVFLGDIAMMLVDPRITIVNKGGSR